MRAVRTITGHLVRLPTLAQLMQWFTVDIENGIVYWRTQRRRNGLPAGYVRKCGPTRCRKPYHVIKVAGFTLYRSHIVFIAKHGHWPHPICDHKDGNSLNDRIDNLREASYEQNAWNHKARKRHRHSHLPMGVREMRSRSGSRTRYQARISYRRKLIHLGCYDTPDEARTVYLAKRKELYGEFA